MPRYRGCSRAGRMRPPDRDGARRPGRAGQGVAGPNVGAEERWHTCFPTTQACNTEHTSLRLSCAERAARRRCPASAIVCQAQREIYFKSHISLWEHSSHFRLVGRGVPSVSVVSQLMYKFLWPPPRKIPRSPCERPGVEPPTSHTASGCTCS